MTVERRRFKRYAVKEDKIEIFNRKLDLKGVLKDISEGGLSYQYTPVNGADDLKEEIDVISKVPGEVYLQRLKCKKIYDILELAGDRTFTGTQVRLKGVEFEMLSENQMRGLASLLKNQLNGI